MAEIETKAWNVVFLTDKINPTKLVLLTRSQDKKFAPGWVTGVGGKLKPGEDPRSSAYRELEEETGIVSVELNEFARCIIFPDLVLYYFWGVWGNDNLPESPDGQLNWVKIDEILEQKIIPTTKVVIAEWAKINFSTSTQFTVFLTEIGRRDGIRQIETARVENGLA